ncbi:MAG: hypothetical protein AAB288_12165, partial [Acidobacteriota bacterium]
PSSTYFPTNMVERAAWCGNFSTQFTDNAVALGFTVGDATANAADCALVVSLSSIMIQLDAYASAVRQYRTLVLESLDGSVTPTFPDNPSYSNPSGPDAGVYDRIDKLVRRIRVSPTYTPEIGALLGILPVSPDRPPVSELKPEITVVDDATVPYSFTMKATRLGMPFYQVQVQRSSSPAWVEASQSSTASHTVTLTPTTPGQPERVLVRAVLIQNGELVGIPSDPAYVTVNP